MDKTVGFGTHRLTKLDLLGVSRKFFVTIAWMTRWVFFCTRVTRFDEGRRKKGWFAAKRFMNVFCGDLPVYLASMALRTDCPCCKTLSYPPGPGWHWAVPPAHRLSPTPTPTSSSWQWTKQAEGLVHYSDVIMDPMASQITNLTIVYSTVYSGADQRKHQSSASLPFVRGIHRWPGIPRTNGL